jgi:hypothetical protein
MGLIKRNFFIVIIASIFLLSLATDWYNGLIIVFLCATIVTILDKLGKGIVLRELIVLHAVFVCLLMPVVGYEIYNQQNHLSRIFVKYMRVPRNEYFGFVLPAVSAFALAICWPITRNKNTIDEGIAFQQLLEKIKERLQLSGRSGIILIAVGVIMFFVQVFLPFELRFIATLFYSVCFAGVLYTFYAPTIRYKKLILTLFTLFIAWTAVQSGVFTIVAYMGITLFSFFFIGKKQKFWKKMVVCLVSIFFLFLIQNIKSAYRHLTWKNNFAGSKTEAFTDIAATKLTSLDEMLDVNAMFPIYARANQGFNVALVMKRIPAVQDFDNGSRLAVIGASSLVPRVLWPNKPQAGGKESMRYFAGINIVGWSTNVSPIGEAYGSFGVRGGIFFMFLLGVFIRWAYKKVFDIAQKTPLLVLWIPVLFFQITYSMETDTLQILNSLFKSAFFVWMLYKIFPHWFGVVRKNMRSMPMINPNRNIPA